MSTLLKMFVVCNNKQPCLLFCVPVSITTKQNYVSVIIIIVIIIIIITIIIILVLLPSGRFLSPTSAPLSAKAILFISTHPSLFSVFLLFSIDHFLILF